MSIGQSPNRDRLLRTAIRLGPMLDEMVFVGGQMVEHLLTDPAAVRIRPTVDVDAIVGVTSRGAWYDLQRRLETLGFAPDTSDGAPICRTRTADGLVLDAMPLDESILGFGNRWYPYAIDTAGSSNSRRRSASVRSQLPRSWRPSTKPSTVAARATR